MFPVDRSPGYVQEAWAAAARLQEQTTPAQYAALVARARRVLSGLFRVEIRLDEETQIRIALRERFVPERVKQAILNVATWRLIEDLAGAWSGRAAAPAPVRRREEPVKVGA
jgi:hypothetical protein